MSVRSLLHTVNTCILGIDDIRCRTSFPISGLSNVVGINIVGFPSIR